MIDDNASEEYADAEISEEFFEHFTITCDPKQTPIRIDKFLIDRVERISRNKLQEAIRAGSIQVDNKTVKSNFKVKPGNVITLILPDPPRSDDAVVPQNIPLDIVYEDEDVIVLNKAAGMVVHPGIGNHNNTLVNALAYYLQNPNLPVKEGNNNDRAGLVHRIDKDTSGLMLVAKTDYAMAHLSKQFFDHTIERRYQALVWGEPKESEGTIDVNVGRNPNDHMDITAFPDGSSGKNAITHYKVLESYYYVSLVECKLETGRTHQIRVHMRYIGNTLFSDKRYGGDKILKGTLFSKYKFFVEKCFLALPRQGLHAKTLGFMHPTKEEWMQFDSELPEDMKSCISLWKEYVSERKTALNQ